MKDEQLRLQTLLLRAQLERTQLKRDAQRLAHHVSPEELSSRLVGAGSQALADVLPSMPTLFDLLRKYPGLSVSVAKSLLKLASSSNKWVATLALGLSSWFVYHRFQERQDFQQKTEEPSADTSNVGGASRPIE